MRFNDIFRTERVILDRQQLWKRKDATPFQKLYKIETGLMYDPDAFKRIFAKVIEDDEKYPDRKSKISEILKRSPFWGKHISKIVR